MVVKNWDSYLDGGATVSSVRHVEGGREITIFTVVGQEAATAREMLVSIGPDGESRIAYRMIPGQCTFSRLLPTDAGHWVGVQEFVSTPTRAKYVFQRDGDPLPAAEPVPFTSTSQGQGALGDVFAIELGYAAGVHVYDRARGQVFTSPTALSSSEIRMSSDGLMYRRADASNDPTLWVWERATGEYSELLDGGANVIGNAQTDGTTLVWMESPPFDPRIGTNPPGTLFSSPHTLSADAIQPTPRWTNLQVRPVDPSAIGGGHYAVATFHTQRIHILRLGDGQRWSVPLPNDGFDGAVRRVASVDEERVLFETPSQIMELQLDALGEGMPPE